VLPASERKVVVFAPVRRWFFSQRENEHVRTVE
jgi:hypothetical protein